MNGKPQPADAIMKLVRVISSCYTLPHISCAMTMLDQFKKMFPSNPYHDALFNLALNKERTILKNYVESSY